MIIRTVVVLFFVFCNTVANAQVLKPGFDADEYIGVLGRCSMQVDAKYRGQLPKEINYERVYRSADMGLHNKWTLWLSRDKSIMVINLRGTTSDIDSWIGNFYSAMIPATGSLKLSSKNIFNYKFADDPKAMVHVGWTIGACSLLPDIMEKVRAYYAQGTKQIIIEGHSQGGALAFLVSSYLHYEVVAGHLPKGLVMKTYCSAAPKPGNLYYAYDFDYVNRGGWAFTVVNAADWVPETPASIQTVRDVNPTNPFSHAKAALRKQKFFVRLYTTHAYNQMTRSADKAQRKYEKYLGKAICKQVKKYLPEYEQPAYTRSCNYTRAGNPIILQPDSAYYHIYPANDTNIFAHHLFDPYYYLVKKIYK
ncbi:MAG: lipase family protein [Chitinophagales bacterium]